MTGPLPLSPVRGGVEFPDARCHPAKARVAYWLFLGTGFEDQRVGASAHAQVRQLLVAREYFAHVICIVFLGTELRHPCTVASCGAARELPSEIPAERMRFVLVPMCAAPAVSSGQAQGRERRA